MESGRSADAAGSDALRRSPGALALGKLALGELAASKAVRLANNKARAGLNMMNTPERGLARPWVMPMSARWQRG